MKKWIITVVVLCLLLMTGLGIVYVQLIPFIKEYGQMEIERFNQLVISHSYFTDQKQYDELVIIERNEENEIALLDFDMVKVNQLANRIVLDIENIYSQIENGTYQAQDESYYQRRMEEVSQRYEFCKEVCDAILEYYETGNGGRIERMIHSIKEEVKWYMYNTLRVYNPEMREEVFSQSVEQFFKTLQERKRTIYGLRPFFYKSARYIMTNMRKRKRKEISKKDEFLEYWDFHASF